MLPKWNSITYGKKQILCLKNIRRMEQEKNPNSLTVQSLTL